jgi:hypothetical protein
MVVRPRLRSVLAALACAVALGLAAAPAASAGPAPRATLAGSCVGAPGPCVVLSRARTATIADGGPATAIALAAPACGLVPPPGSVICGLGAAAAGPGIAFMAKEAVEQGRCVGFAPDFVARTLKVGISRCYE